jgi:hypothetical protein
MCALCEENPFIRIIHDEDEAPKPQPFRAEAVAPPESAVPPAQGA